MIMPPLLLLVGMCSNLQSQVSNSFFCLSHKIPIRCIKTSTCNVTKSTKNSALYIFIGFCMPKLVAVEETCCAAELPTYLLMFASTQASCLSSEASTGPTLSAASRCTIPPATTGGCSAAWYRPVVTPAWPCWAKPSTWWAALTETSSSARWRCTTPKRMSGTTALKPRLLSPSEGEERPGLCDRVFGISQCFTHFQTNRLSDVILFRDVFVYERVYVGGDVEVRRLQWRLAYSWQVREGGGDIAAQSNMTPFAYCIDFGFVLYIFCFFLRFVCHMPTFDTHLVLFFSFEI